MRVDRTAKRKASGAGSARSGASRSGAIGEVKGTFLSSILVANRENVRGTLDKLIVAIDAQAKEIEKSLTIESLEKYRELVKEFIGIAVNELYVVEEKLSVNTVGRQKSLLLVKRINETLEDLTNNFLERQKNLIQFIATLDQIRGMLLDLYT